MPAVLGALDTALSMLFRSALQYTVFSASLFGLQCLALGTELRAYGKAELADTRFVVEKFAALGGFPTPSVTPFDGSGDPSGGCAPSGAVSPRSGRAVRRRR